MRALATGQPLPCGCLVGVYHTWSEDVVALIDAVGDHCRQHHDINLVLWRRQGREDDSDMRRVPRRPRESTEEPLSAADTSFPPTAAAEIWTGCAENRLNKIDVSDQKARFPVSSNGKNPMDPA